jgi:hypothetical protein
MAAVSLPHNRDVRATSGSAASHFVAAGDLIVPINTAAAAPLPLHGSKYAQPETGPRTPTTVFCAYAPLVSVVAGFDAVNVGNVPIGVYVRRSDAGG